MRKVFALILFIAFSLPISAQKEELTRILFVFDASNSMNGKWDESTRIAIAKELLIKAVDSLQGVPNLELALRIYGHQSPITPTYQDCEDTKLEVPFSKGNHNLIKAKIRSVVPKGTTPIARSLEAAADDFPDKNARNVIVLITDGIEACDHDPCVIADKLRAKGISIRPFVIGIGIDMEYLNHFDCIGTYLDANSKASFASVLTTVLNSALIATTVQVNLNDIYGKPMETNVTFNLYKSGTKTPLYSYTHTLNKFKLPDTLVINDKIQYDIEVFTTPVVRKSGITIKRNQHNIIEVDAPRGSLLVRFSNALREYPVQTRVMQHGKPKTLNIQEMNQLDMYIVGKYDLEILTLPRIYKTVDINQSSKETVNIPAPGIFNYKSSTKISGQLFVINDKNEMEWVANLDTETSSGSWNLQPGNYRIVYRPFNAMNTLHTDKKDFRILSNKTTSLNF
jgi:Ca-activated chloride channel family protein